ncbi:hypothetical protein HPB51_028433 [Rhipicephalus microplus]|uniref:Uncharacterized protein n=1 Tax=Rhipicephalus microplus TaxID=6941 RepID=A0A9J6CXT1_RHIMP|nr:hypothetical protein HPB51_028433 [Rhipicephalus microplus]
MALIQPLIAIIVHIRCPMNWRSLAIKWLLRQKTPYIIIIIIIIGHDCASGARLCRGVPAECIGYNAVYTILHYLADVDFLAPVDNRGDVSDELIDDWDGGGSKQNDSSSAQSSQGRLVQEPHFSYTSVFLPLGQSTMAMSYFKDLEEYGHLEDDVTQVMRCNSGNVAHIRCQQGLTLFLRWHLPCFSGYKPHLCASQSLIHSISFYHS